MLLEVFLVVLPRVLQVACADVCSSESTLGSLGQESSQRARHLLQAGKTTSRQRLPEDGSGYDVNGPLEAWDKDYIDDATPSMGADYVPPGPSPSRQQQSNEEEQPIVSITEPESIANTEPAGDVGPNTFGPAGCVSVLRTEQGTCKIETDCGDSGLESIEFAFGCLNPGADPPHALHSYGLGGFAAKESFDTGVKCEKCITVANVFSQDGQVVQNALDELPEGVVSAAMDRPAAEPLSPGTSDGDAPSGIGGGEAGKEVKANDGMRNSATEAAYYGPDACVATFSSPAGTCIVETRCEEAALLDFNVGVTCLDAGGDYFRYLFGKGSFAARETFDTRLQCQSCLGISPDDADSQNQGTLSKQLVQDVNGLKTEVQQLKSQVKALKEQRGNAESAKTEASSKDAVENSNGQTPKKKEGGEDVVGEAGEGEGAGEGEVEGEAQGEGEGEGGEGEGEGEGEKPVARPKVNVKLAGDADSGPPGGHHEHGVFAPAPSPANSEAWAALAPAPAYAAAPASHNKPAAKPKGKPSAEIQRNLGQSPWTQGYHGLAAAPRGRRPSLKDDRVIMEMGANAIISSREDTPVVVHRKSSGKTLFPAFEGMIETLGSQQIQADKAEIARIHEEHEEHDPDKVGLYSAR